MQRRLVLRMSGKNKKKRKSLLGNVDGGHWQACRCRWWVDVDDVSDADDVLDADGVCQMQMCVGCRWMVCQMWMRVDVDGINVDK